MHGPAVLFLGIFHLLLQCDAPIYTLSTSPPKKMVPSTATGCHTAVINQQFQYDLMVEKKKNQASSAVAYPYFVPGLPTVCLQQVMHRMVNADGRTMVPTNGWQPCNVFWGTQLMESFHVSQGYVKICLRAMPPFQSTHLIHHQHLSFSRKPLDFCTFEHTDTNALPALGGWRLAGGFLHPSTSCRDLLLQSFLPKMVLFGGHLNDDFHFCRIEWLIQLQMCSGGM